MKLDCNYERYKGMGTFIAFMEFGLSLALSGAFTKGNIFLFFFNSAIKT